MKKVFPKFLVRKVSDTSAATMEYTVRFCDVDGHEFEVLEWDIWDGWCCCECAKAKVSEIKIIVKFSDEEGKEFEIVE